MKAASSVAAFLLCWFAAAHAGAAGAAATLPAPLDLQRDARQAQASGKPLLILFSLPGCRFCDEVRQNYLAPLLRGVPVAERPIIHEIEIGGTQTFVGLQGERTSHRSFASNFNIRIAPTVVFIDSSGQHLTAPIVGGDTAGLYGGYLDNAFAEAAQKLAAGGRHNSIGAKP